MIPSKHCHKCIPFDWMMARFHYYCFFDKIRFHIMYLSRYTQWGLSRIWTLTVFSNASYSMSIVIVYEKFIANNFLRIQIKYGCQVTPSNHEVDKWGTSKRRKYYHWWDSLRGKRTWESLWKEGKGSSKKSVRKSKNEHEQLLKEK